MTVDSKGMEMAIARLSGDKLRAATSAAMKSTAQRGAEFVAAEANKRLNLRDPIMLTKQGRNSRDKIRPINWRQTKFTAEVTVKRVPIPASAFHAAASPSGVSVWFWRDRSPERFRHAFYAKMPFLHMGHYYQRAKSAGKPSKRGNGKYKGGNSADGIAWRVPLAILRGPTIHDAINVAAVLRRIETELGTIAQEQMLSELSKRTGINFAKRAS
jgi:hypothetical protein